MRLPLSFELSGKKIILVGGGRAACEKFMQLARTPCVLVIIALKISDALASLLETPHTAEITVHKRRFQPQDIEGAFMVFSAVDDALVSEQIFSLCRSNNILINSADNPKYCDFYTTAVIERGAVQLAVSTGGRFAGLAAILRRHLDSLFPEALDEAWEEIFKLRERAVALHDVNEKKSVILNIVREIETRYFNGVAHERKQRDLDDGRP